MNNTKFNPAVSNRSFNNFFNELFGEFPVIYNESRKASIPVNIIETETHFSIELVAPGFSKADFKISVEKDILTVAAEKASSEENKNEKVIRKEFSSINFKRSFTLDTKIDSAAIEAGFENGILSLTLPKKEEVKEATKEIAVK